MQKALAGAQVKWLYAAQGLAPQGSSSPGDFAKYAFADFERIGKLMKIVGIKPE